MLPPLYISAFKRLTQQHNSVISFHSKHLRWFKSGCQPFKCLFDYTESPEVKPVPVHFLCPQQIARWFQFWQQPLAFHPPFLSICGGVARSSWVQHLSSLSHRILVSTLSLIHSGQYQQGFCYQSREQTAKHKASCSTQTDCTQTEKWENILFKSDVT